MEGGLSENYYDILNIGRDASLDDIKKAYKKMAFQYHPDKNKDAGAEEKFKQLTEAYKVLNHPMKRRIYDEQKRNGFGSWSGFENVNEDPRETFRNFFPEYHDRFCDDNDSFDMTQEKYTKSSKMSDSKNFSERSHQSSSTNNCEYTNTGSSGHCGNKRKPNFTDGFGAKQNFSSSAPKRPCPEPEQSSTSTASPQKDPTIEKPLELSLEELSTGCTKKLRIKRTIHNGQSSREEEKVVEIVVKPGWKAGTRITFPETGDKKHGTTPADITFIVKDKPHSLFSRDSDNNLLHKANISLKSALLGLSYCIRGLNGTRHTVNVSDIIHPGFVKRYPGEGLPLPKTPAKRGDLVVTFDIQFPKSLSWDQRRTLSECLPE